MPRWAVTLLLFVATVVVGTPSHAWTPESQRTLALEAARLSPPDLRRQIDKHPEYLQRGTLEPFKGSPGQDHYWHKDGTGNLDHVLFAEVDATIEAIRGHRPFTEIVERLGRVAHYVADANNPLNSDSTDPEESRYFVDYLRYAQSVQTRFALVYYAEDPAVNTDREMRLMVYRALHRGRQLYPLVGAEYRRIEFGNGMRLFDDRSTAFGVAAVAYSHALSDIARIYRYIWLQAGGTDQGLPIQADAQGLYLLPPRDLDAR
ncbi:MAG: hypothetical protein K8J08_13675 [Thermoanaerobaculia bacterium]|nr:hypothetical protein [Thermoanaerobaculia bacterium]